jgi:POU domain transcription factor, class 4
MFQMHGMENLDIMGDPTGSMTTLTPMSETPIASSHHQLHGSYHSMNHMMSHHHHGGPLSGHTPGQINQTFFFRPFYQTFLDETS